MPFTVTMPKLSPTMEGGTLTRWHKKEGEWVKPGEVLFEVATDKATVEHSAIDKGLLRQILVQEGEFALVNQAVAVFTETAEESIENYIPEGVSPPSAQKEKVTEDTIVENKAEEPASQASRANLSYQAVVFTPEPPLEKITFSLADPDKNVVASPYARKLAKEKQVDLRTVSGSGPGGSVVGRDLEALPASAQLFPPREKPSLPGGTYEEEPLTWMRKVIGERLQASKMLIPHFYVSQEIKGDALDSFRQQLKEGGYNISVNDCIIKAVALALEKHPAVNSGFNSQNQTLIRFKTVDISIAVSVPDGLITPIIRHANYKNLSEIATESRLLSSKARAGKLQREEYMGGSFTISNLGMYGITSFLGVINPPQAAILSIGTLEEKPLVEKGQLRVGKVMILNLSADHRVIDGIDAAQFLKTVQKFLENPSLLLI
jgi:pyruvate dehydrogenase E2 component (dihydrolipoamide acetyltransferase)